MRYYYFSEGEQPNRGYTIMIDIKNSPLDDVKVSAQFFHPSYGTRPIQASFSFITNGTKLTFDTRFSYYGNIIFARDWDRAGFMSI